VLESCQDKKLFHPPKEDDVELTDFAVKIGNHTFEHPIMNAAGHVKKHEHVKELLPSEVAGIVAGSILPVDKERFGNVEGTNYLPGPQLGLYFSLNSLGIPCQDLNYYNQHLPGWVRETKLRGKHLILNIAGFKPDDYILLAQLAIECGVEIIEVNFGCPNLVDSGEQKPIFSYDFEAMYELLKLLELVLENSNIELWIKVSWLDPFQLKRTAEMFSRFPRIVAVTAINTLANCMFFNEKARPMITPNKGRAGLSGPALLPAALGQVSMRVEALAQLRSSVKVIGSGGIRTGSDVFQFIQGAGAAAVEVGTAYFDYCDSHRGEGGHIFSTMFREYTEALEKYHVRA
jgi:dihydroorotate dehydrogenase (fumarate)